MKEKDIVQLIKDLESKGEVMKPVVNVSPVDRFDILALDKVSAKKLTVEDLQSVISYIRSYGEQYINGMFMFRKDSRGACIADFDEAGVYHELILVMNVLRAELNKR